MGLNVGQCWKKNPLDAAKDNDLNSDPAPQKTCSCCSRKRWFHKLRGAVFLSSPYSFFDHGNCKEGKLRKSPILKPVIFYQLTASPRTPDEGEAARIGSEKDSDLNAEVDCGVAAEMSNQTLSWASSTDQSQSNQAWPSSQGDIFFHSDSNPSRLAANELPGPHPWSSCLETPETSTTPVPAKLPKINAMPELNSLHPPRGNERKWVVALQPEF